jgi:tagatose 1,6-diphosphate aldolase
VKQTLTPGKWRNLKQTSTAKHIFTILAFDQRSNYRRMLPEGTSYETAVQIKRDVVVSLSHHVSAVLLDPIYGLPSALDMAGTSGLLMALEKSGYSGDSTYRRLEFIEDWSVGKIKRMGASAVKLLVYYHPETGELADELERTIHQVALDCQSHDLPFFLEPVSYSVQPGVSKQDAAFAETRPDVVRQTARRLSQLGADVLKLEFPLDVAFNDDRAAWRSACEAISDVCRVPWVLLSAGVDFDVFEEQVRIACETGASGFLAGRAIWKEAVSMTAEERQRFLTTTAAERLRRLGEVATALARPWTDFYTYMVDGKDWFESYDEPEADASNRSTP